MGDADEIDLALAHQRELRLAVPVLVVDEVDQRRVFCIFSSGSMPPLAMWPTSGVQPVTEASSLSRMAR